MSRPGHADAVVGLIDGDEGKGKVVDERLESGDYEIDVRFNGGNNAGHSLDLKNGKYLILNSIPSGVLHPEITNYIGSGCVVDPVQLWEKEIPNVEKVANLTGKLKISGLATTITPVHIFWDKICGLLIGTTGKGIGPAYTDKAKRAEGDDIRNLRICDVLANPLKAEEIIKKSYSDLLKLIKYCVDPIIIKKRCQNLGLHVTGESNPEALVKALEIETKMSDQILKFIIAIASLEQRGFIEKDPLWLTKQVESGKNVLMEGAQSFGLDVTYGTVPYQTSSSTVAGNAFVGGDLSAKYHGQIIGVAKVIASRVGSGPFVGELGGRKSEVYCDAKNSDGSPFHNKDEEALSWEAEDLLKSDDPFLFGIGLRIRTKEYGATTGRPRRVGVFDAMRLAYAARRTGVDKLYINKFDCLREYRGNNLFKGEIPLITGYKLNGKEIDYVPCTADEQYRVEPVYENITAFSEDLVEMRLQSELPNSVRALVEKIQTIARAKIGGIGVGPGRNQIVYFK